MQILPPRWRRHDELGRRAPHAGRHRASPDSPRLLGHAAERPEDARSAELLLESSGPVLGYRKRHIFRLGSPCRQTVCPYSKRSIGPCLTIPLLACFCSLTRAASSYERPTACTPATVAPAGHTSARTTPTSASSPLSRRMTSSGPRICANPTRRLTCACSRFSTTCSRMTAIRGSHLPATPGRLQAC